MGWGWAKRVMGNKEDTCYDEYWVLYVSDESPSYITENNTLNVN